MILNRKAISKVILYIAVFILIYSFIPTGYANAESWSLKVTIGGSADELAQCILGDEVSYTNAKIHRGDKNCTGFFYGGLDEVGFDRGIILSTGNCKLVEENKNSKNIQSTITNGGNDSELTALCNGASYDTCYLTFDTASIEESISFDFVLASEEYGKNVNWADTFGIFYVEIDKEGNVIGEYQNMAWVPDTNPKEPVSVRTINNKYNSHLYRPNYGKHKGNIQSSMNGFTSVITAKQNLDIDKRYRIKLAICDMGDSSVDTNIFIKARNSKHKAQQTKLEAIHKRVRTSTYAVVIERKGCVRRSMVVEWQANDAEGNQVCNGTAHFKSGEAQTQIVVYKKATKLRLYNATYGIDMESQEIDVKALDNIIVNREKPLNKVVKLMGTIVDVNEKPIPGMIIKLHAGPITDITDDKGIFEFEDVVLKNHELIVKDKNGEYLSSFEISFEHGSRFYYSTNREAVDVRVISTTKNLNF